MNQTFLDDECGKLAGKQTRKLFLTPLAVFRMNKYCRIHAQQLFAATTHKPCKSCIAIDHPAIQIEDGQTGRGVLKDLAQWLDRNLGKRVVFLRTS